MAKCEEGYLCDICGGDVGEIHESDLYLRYVLGLVDPEVLHTSAERHIRCNPALGQFIVDDEFAPLEAEGDFGKSRLDPEFRSAREEWVTRGWRRLKEVAGSGISILEYPLPEVLAKLREREA